MGFTYKEEARVDNMSLRSNSGYNSKALNCVTNSKDIKLEMVKISLQAQKREASVREKNEVVSSSIIRKDTTTAISKATNRLTDEQKKRKRILSNRKSAKASQKRRKAYINDLQATYEDLSSQNNTFREENMKLRQMKELLQRQLLASTSLNNSNMFHTSVFHNNTASIALPPQKSLPLTTNSHVISSTMANASAGSISNDTAATASIHQLLKKGFSLMGETLSNHQLRHQQQQGDILQQLQEQAQRQQVLLESWTVGKNYEKGTKYVYNDVQMEQHKHQFMAEYNQTGEDLLLHQYQPSHVSLPLQRAASYQ